MAITFGGTEKVQLEHKTPHSAILMKEGPVTFIHVSEFPQAEKLSKVIWQPSISNLNTGWTKSTLPPQYTFSKQELFGNPFYEFKL